MKRLLAIVALFMFGQAEAGGLQFQCDESDGYAYYAKEGIFSKNGGWSKDPLISREYLIYFDLDTLTIDYRSKNNMDVWMRPADRGGTLTLISVDDDGSFVFMVAYNGATKLVTVAEIDTRTSTAIMLETTVSNTSDFTYSQVSKSDCRVVAF